MTNATEQSGGAQTRIDPRATIARQKATIAFLNDQMDVQVTAQFHMQEEINRLTAEAAKLSGEVDKLREERTEMQNRLSAYEAEDEANHGS